MDEVFDEAGLLDTVQGDRELFAELTSLFLAETPRHIDAVRDAIQRSDPQALRFAAHALKGSASTVTARRVAREAFELETMGLSGNLSGAPERFQAVEAAILELRQRLG